MNLIENIKLFLSVENCLFIIGVDKEVLSKGIQVRYGRSLISGDEYLEKIINLSFSLPVPDYMAQMEFINDIMKRATSAEWFDEMKEEIGLFGSIISSLGIDNSRRLRILCLRYLFFLDMEGHEKYIVEIIIKLIVYRELFRDAYDQKKLHHKINYFPDIWSRNPDAIGVGANRLTFEQIEEISCRGFAILASSPQYERLIAFTEETKLMLELFNKTDEELQDYHNKIINTGANIIKPLEYIMQNQINRDANSYFYLVDFLFSLY